MRDEDHASAFFAQPREDAEQPFDLRRRQSRSRLIEDDDARAGKQHARQFDQLLHADREIAKACARVDVEPEVLELFGRALGHAPPGDDAHPVDRLGAEKNILGHAQFRRDAELLMHHADAGGQRVAGGAEMDLPLVDAHGSAIGGMDAGDDLHHRAFAGAVLAGETMNLAGVQGEVDIPKRLDAAKRLRNVGQFKQRHRASTRDQMRNCSSIHNMPSAFFLVTTGPSATMFFGIPAFAPWSTA